MIPTETQSKKRPRSKRTPKNPVWVQFHHGNIKKCLEIDEFPVQDALDLGQIKDYGGTQHGYLGNLDQVERFTLCTLHVGRRKAVGYAFCGPRDQYEKAKGRKISLGRAISAYYKKWKEVPVIPNTNHPKDSIPF